MSKSKKLNSQQLKFCKGISDGLSNTAAYQAAYKGARNKIAAGSSATKLLTNPKVIEKVDELRQSSETKDTLSRREVREKRAAMVRNVMTEDRDVLKACADEAKMMGWDSPEELNVNNTGTIAMSPIEFVCKNAKTLAARKKNKKS